MSPNISLRPTGLVPNNNSLADMPTVQNDRGSVRGALEVLSLRCWGERSGKGCPIPSQLRIWGVCRKFPQWGRGWRPGWPRYSACWAWKSIWWQEMCCFRWFREKRDLMNPAWDSGPESGRISGKVGMSACLVFLMFLPSDPVNLK